jgi:hypothetical protein
VKAQFELRVVGILLVVEGVRQSLAEHPYHINMPLEPWVSYAFIAVGVFLLAMTLGRKGNKK